MKRFSTSHEWVERHGDIGTIGISHAIQKEIGDIVAIDLPLPGLKIAAGELIALVESRKAAIEISTPVSGIVLAINPSLQENPSLLNKAPETTGWICKIHLADPAEYEALLEKESYLAQ